MKHNPSYWLIFTLSVFFIVTACAALQPSPSEPAAIGQPAATVGPAITDAPTTEPPTQVPPATTTPPDPIVTIDPAALCPQPGSIADTSLYVSRENGFCLLVPAGFSLRSELLRPDDVIELVGPTQAMGPKQQEGVSVYMRVEYNGPAEAMDSAAYAQEWHKRFAAPDEPFEASQATVNGQPATVLRNLSGFARQRAAFVIANGARYRISLMPQPEDMPELAEPAGRGWETVLSSLVFFPPARPVQAVRAEEVCPAETTDAKLYTHEIDGYCFLYPADFTAQVDFPGTVSSDVVVGQWEGGDVRPSLTVGNYFGEPGLTPQQLLDKRIEFVQAGSIQDAIIGGYPAVTYIDINGAWPSQQAIVVADAGRSYSVLAQPLDPARFPDAPPYVQRVWETVTGSLVFFDPWR